MEVLRSNLKGNSFFLLLLCTWKLKDILKPEYHFPIIILFISYYLFFERFYFCILSNITKGDFLFSDVISKKTLSFILSSFGNFFLYILNCKLFLNTSHSSFLRDRMMCNNVCSKGVKFE